MDDLQQTPRVADDSTEEQQEASRSQQASTVFTARSLANPRRTRL
jgi:hypothetical protein